MAELIIGTCSWKYESWRGVVYSDSSKINYLKEYSKHFKSVEIDQWFWSLHGENKVSLPDPKVIEAYKMSVPNEFKFSVKLPNSISLTHFYKKSKTEPLKENPYFFSVELYKQIMQLLGSFGDMLGPCMLQFEYLNIFEVFAEKSQIILEDKWLMSVIFSTKGLVNCSLL